MLKNLMLWLIIVVIFISVFSNFSHVPQVTNMTYSEFIKQVNQGGISSVTIEGQGIHGKTKNNKSFTTHIPKQDPYLISNLVKKGISVEGKSPEQYGFLIHLLINWFPMLLLVLCCFFFLYPIVLANETENRLRRSY